MLIEQRCYTLRLGVTQAFWDAQRVRGDGLRERFLTQRFHRQSAAMRR